MKLSRFTRIRHWFVNKIAPTLYIQYIESLKNLPRPTTIFIKKIFKNKPLIGVEIGVHSGLNAETILKSLNIKKLYLIDPYEFYIQKGLAVFYSGREEEAKFRLKKYKDRIAFIKMKSSLASNHIPDNLDFVYIDGNHEYVYVKQDIEKYFPKLKIGGVMGGHDYNPNRKIKLYDVYEAVNEFAFKNGLKVKNDLRDWWFRKWK